MNPKNAVDSGINRGIECGILGLAAAIGALALEHLGLVGAGAGAGAKVAITAMIAAGAVGSTVAVGGLLFGAVGLGLYLVVTGTH